MEDESIGWLSLVVLPRTTGMKEEKGTLRSIHLPGVVSNEWHHATVSHPSRSRRMILYRIPRSQNTFTATPVNAPKLKAGSTFLVRAEQKPPLFLLDVTPESVAPCSACTIWLALTPPMTTSSSGAHSASNSLLSKDPKSKMVVSALVAIVGSGRRTLGAPEGAKGTSFSSGFPLKNVKVLAKRPRFQLLSGDGGACFMEIARGVEVHANRARFDDLMQGAACMNATA
mmetsp:Transcript_55234/g.112996  ORF Transcript_55234/g.112996 Transcript_55234/m.112996 type:complete len:228 (+) Transcript_55234:409-1092(+)